MAGTKDGINHVAYTKLKPVIALQIFAIDAFTVYKGAMFTALVYNREFAIFRHDHGMIEGDSRVCDYNVFIYLTSDGKRAMVDADGALFPVLHQNQLGK